MTARQSPMQLLANANRARRSARLLLGDGDFHGACNRAYYAMFSAARAALGDLGTVKDSKTHAGVRTAFSLHLVQTGKVAPEIAKVLKRALQFRVLADYIGDGVDQENAAQIVADCDEFVAAIITHLDPSKP